MPRSPSTKVETSVDAAESVRQARGQRRPPGLFLEVHCRSPGVHLDPCPSWRLASYTSHPTCVNRQAPSLPWRAP